MKPRKTRTLPNFYEIRGDVAFLKIQRRDGSLTEVIFDAADLPLVQKYVWRICNGYVMTVIAPTEEYKGSYRYEWLGLNRVLMGVGKAKKVRVDFANHNPLDCRRANLRFATISQNLSHRELPRRVNPYRGVHCTASKAFRATIRLQSLAEQTETHYRYLGIYRTGYEAARVYDYAALNLYGEFATLNFPEDRQKYEMKTIPMPTRLTREDRRPKPRQFRKAS